MFSIIISGLGITGPRGILRPLESRPTRSATAGVLLSSVLVPLLLVVGGCAQEAGRAQESSHPVLPQESIAWPGLNSTTSAQPGQSGATATPAAPQRVAPVSTLVQGLRARLEATPEDPKGWALLAQSYAFVGDSEAAEEALGRAVALGFDEADLRERVRMAVSSPAAQPSWVDQALSR